MSRLTYLAAAAVFALAPAIALAQTDINPDIGADNDAPLAGLSDATIWALIFGMLSPWLAGMLNKVQWQPVVKTAVFVAVALVLSAVSVFINGGLDATNWTRTALIVVATGAGFYKLWQRPVQQVEGTVNP